VWLLTEFHKGDRVKFTRGFLKGFYGIVTRIKRETEYEIEQVKMLTFFETPHGGVLVSPKDIWVSSAIIEPYPEQVWQ
jgi:ribosomal protein L24